MASLALKHISSRLPIQFPHLSTEFGDNDGTAGGRVTKYISIYSYDFGCSEMSIFKLL
jgi:hypothetical protein